MQKRISTDLLGAGLVLALGLFVFCYALSLPTGILRRVGPGFLPMTYGAILIAAGAILGLSACFKPTDTSEVAATGDLNWRPWVLIPASLITFALLMRYSGLVPAAFCVSFLGALADRRNSWRDAAVLGLVIVVISVVVFWWILSVQIPLWRGF